MARELRTVCFGLKITAEGARKSFLDWPGMNPETFRMWGLGGED